MATGSSQEHRGHRAGSQELQAGRGVPSFPGPRVSVLSRTQFLLIPLARSHLNTQTVRSLKSADRGASCLCSSVACDRCVRHADGHLPRLFPSERSPARQFQH